MNATPGGRVLLVFFFIMEAGVGWEGGVRRKLTSVFYLHYAIPCKIRYNINSRCSLEVGLGYAYIPGYSSVCI